MFPTADKVVVSPIQTSCHGLEDACYCLLFIQIEHRLNLICFRLNLNFIKKEKNANKDNLSTHCSLCFFFLFFSLFYKGTDSSTSAKYENILFLVSTLIFFMCTN